METIKYNGVTISVPSCWSDINLGFYEVISNKKPETRRELVALVAKVCNVEDGLLLSWPAVIFNDIEGYLEFMFKGELAAPNPEIVIDGVRYIVSVEDDLTLGEWVDIEQVQNQGEKVLSNILAIVCRPAGEEYEPKNNDSRAAMFSDLPVSKVLGLLAFFLQCKTVSEQRMAAFTNMAQMLGQLPTSIKPFLKRGAGIRLSTIWQVVKYYFIMMLLHYRLRKFLHTCNIRKTKTMHRKHKVN